MNQILINDLNKRFHFLKRNESNPQSPYDQRGFEIEDGWYSLLHDLLEELEALFIKHNLPLLDLRIMQVKEKFGLLRVYTDPCLDETNKILNKYEKLSQSVCQDCGQEGTLRVLGGGFTGYWLTSCDACELARLKGLDRVPQIPVRYPLMNGTEQWGILELRDDSYFVSYLPYADMKLVPVEFYKDAYTLVTPRDGHYYDKARTRWYRSILPHKEHPMIQELLSYFGVLYNSIEFLEATRGVSSSFSDQWVKILPTDTFESVKALYAEWSPILYTTNVENCPYCQADLQGDPIPQESQHHYGSTHFSRKLAIYDHNIDKTTKFQCPDCEKQWEA